MELIWFGIGLMVGMTAMYFILYRHMRDIWKILDQIDNKYQTMCNVISAWQKKI